MEVLDHSAGGEPGPPVSRALGWTIGVVLLGALPALVIVPAAQGRGEPDQPAQLRSGSFGSGSFGPATEVAAASEPAGGAPTPATIAAAQSTAVATTATAATRRSPTTASTAGNKTTTKAAIKSPAPPAAPTSAAAAPAPRLQPDPGSYPLAISGTSTVDGKPASLPSTGSLVVRQLSASDQSQQTAGLPGNLVLVQRAGVGGVDLVSFNLTASSKTLTFSPPSPLAFVRTDVPIGTSWSWSARATDGSVSVSQAATVTNIGPVNVGGTSVPSVTVERVLTTTGTMQGTVRLTTAVSLLDRLPLVQRQVLDVKASVLGLFSTRIVSDVTTTLTSTRPR